MIFEGRKISPSIYIAIGLALGLGICALFILNNMSNNMRTASMQQQSPQSNYGVTYSYDENGKLKSMMPVRLKGIE